MVLRHTGMPKVLLRLSPLDEPESDREIGGSYNGQHEKDHEHTQRHQQFQRVH
jgi:hypothetical protein